MNTLKLVASTLILFSGAALSQTAPQTGSSPESLTRCLRLNTSGNDRLMTARWFLTSLGSADAVSGAVVVNPAARLEANKAFAALWVRLSTKDCRTELKPMLKKDTGEAFGFAGQILGQIAMQEVLTSPSAEKAVSEFVNYVSEADMKSVESLVAEAQSK